MNSEGKTEVQVMNLCAQCARKMMENGSIVIWKRCCWQRNL